MDGSGETTHFFHGNDFFSHPIEKTIHILGNFTKIIPKPECFGPTFLVGFPYFSATLNGSIWDDQPGGGQVASPFAQIVVVK